MSQVTKPIFLDETGKDILAVMNQQTAYLGALARSSVNTIATSWEDIHAVVQQGLASTLFNIGDQLIVPWRDVAGETDYEVPLNVLGFRNATLRDGSVVPAMWLQWHYCTPWGVAFDAPENEQASESTYLADYSYYTTYTNDSGETAYRLLVEGEDYTVGGTIPSSMVLYHSAIKDPTGNICRYGYNRWSHSAQRQWLNSKKGVGEWWTAQHLGDVAPEQLSSKAGFMSGFGEDFLACLKPVKVTTALNTDTDADIGTTEDTYDTFFLPSLEEIYAVPQLAGAEGEYFDYWRQAVGKPSPNGWYGVNANPAYITYAIDDKIYAQNVRLRSAIRNASYNTWFQNASGFIGNYAVASGADFRCVPICAIC